MADPVVVETKKPWLSKTLWLNLIMAISALFFPVVADFIKQHAELTLVFWSVINGVLRLVSKDKISLND